MHAHIACIIHVLILFLFSPARTLATKRLCTSKDSTKQSRVRAGNSLVSTTEREIGEKAQEKVTLLMHSGRSACVITIVVYFLLQWLIYQNYYSSVPICRYDEALQYSPLAKSVSLGAFVFFAIGCCMHMYEMFSDCSNGPNVTLHLTTFTIQLIAGSSSFLTYFYDWGGICKDQFDVVSPASQWPEWATSVPLLVYVALATDSRRKKLRKKEIVIICAMTFCICAGFMLQLPVSFLWSALILVFAMFSILSIILMIHRDHKKEIISKDPDSTDTLNEEIKSVSLEREIGKISSAMKTRTLTYLLFFVFPVFPLVYLLAMAGLFDFNQTLIGWQIAGVFAKLMFAALAVRSHRSVADKFVALLDAEIQPMVQRVVQAIDIEDWGNEA